MKKKSSTRKRVGKIVTKEKATKTLKSTGNFIADNKKELLYVAGGILVVAVGYKVYKNLQKGSEVVTDFIGKDHLENIDVTVNTDANKLTITQEQAQQFARTIYDACNIMAPLYGTDENAILEVFKKLQTGDDYKLVYKTFGMKEYNGNNAPPRSGWGRLFDVFEPRDLNYWLRSELSPSDGEVYTVVKSRIESAGYSF
ncbi:hypothetical protein [Tenacibaculum caenipelagi]|uniref:Uncharacterized protein n=1 Tax=Tenacibaculum caenipelagi TaxID=1325435 RepID=A0A4R6TB10_9FLAO|nr:hypothetical protein [Tenacibaculum caenipelagi]TDQ22749.1 hypothetical protein DFQ07_2767 [Tenacibaculum caenipelagi]